MKKFNFRLQTLLKLEESREKIATNNLLKIQQKLEQEERQLKMYVKRVMSDSSKRQTVNGGTDTELKPGKLVSLPAQKLVSDIVNSKAKIRDFHLELEEKRKELNVIMKRRKVLTRLKEKKFQEYQYDSNREEQKESDEIARSLYNLKTING